MTHHSKSSINQTFFKDIRELILSARKTVVRNVDAIQVITNFEIGRRIVEHEQQGESRAGYGKTILKVLSDRLVNEFGRGFSDRNLRNMRQFYLLYQDRGAGIWQMPSAKLVEVKKCQMPSGKLAEAEKAQTLSAKLDAAQKWQTSSAKSPKQKSQTLSWKFSKSQTPSDQFGNPPFTLSWSHYVFLLGLNDPDERRFYEIESSEQNWSLRELKRQFNSSLYERLALSRDKKGVRQLSKKGQVVDHPEDLLKEPYVLEFLGLDEKSEYSESDLEAAVINKLEHFLLEMGKGFLFEARQKRFTFDEDHFFVDLVFYNRLLKCYVLVDLKIGKLTHQDLGQMQMYVNYFDRYVRTEYENRTVGIILCRKNKEAMVEITLPEDANIHAREYRLYLPSKAELKRKLLDWSE